jgi:hypothetical protein
LQAEIDERHATAELAKRVEGDPNLGHTVHMAIKAGKKAVEILAELGSGK